MVYCIYLAQVVIKRAMKKRVVFSILLFVCSLQLQANILTKKLSFEVHNITLIQALERLEVKAGITFSFNSTCINQQRIVSIKAQNQTLDYIVGQLLKNENVGYYAVQTQIIIYKLKTPKSETAKPTTEKTTATNKKIIIDTIPIIVYDTIPFIDTVSFIDTVRLHILDTVIFYDTIQSIIEKPNNAHWFIGIQYQNQGFTQKNVSKNTWNDSVQIAENFFVSNQYAIEVGIQKNSYRISSGIGYSQFSQKGDYNIRNIARETKTETSLTTKYIVDSTYFVMAPLDTIWFVKNDSIIELQTITTTTADTTHSIYKGNNTFSAINIPISFSYEKSLNPHFEILGCFQFNTYIISKSQGMLYNSKTNSIQEISEVIHPVFCNSQISAGIGYLYNHLTFQIMPMVSYGVSSPFSIKSTSFYNKISGGCNVKVLYTL